MGKILQNFIFLSRNETKLQLSVAVFLDLFLITGLMDPKNCEIGYNDARCSGTVLGKIIF